MRKRSGTSARLPSISGVLVAGVGADEVLIAGVLLGHNKIGGQQGRVSEDG